MRITQGTANGARFVLAVKLVVPWDASFAQADWTGWRETSPLGDIGTDASATGLITALGADQSHCDDGNGRTACHLNEVLRALMLPVPVRV